MAARVTLVVAVGCLMTAGLEVWLTFQFGGLTREQHDYLQILEGPLYEDVPHAGVIRDIWADVAGVNACGPDRIDIRYTDYYLYAPAPFCHDQLTIAARHGERGTVTPNQATYEIWMFGGSTILDIGVVDADTISS